MVFTFGHLWFIFHLFLYSLVFLPIVLFLRRGFGRKIVDLLARAAAKPVVILAFELCTLAELVHPELGAATPSSWRRFCSENMLAMSPVREGCGYSQAARL